MDIVSVPLWLKAFTTETQRTQNDASPDPLADQHPGALPARAIRPRVSRRFVDDAGHCSPRSRSAKRDREADPLRPHIAADCAHARSFSDRIERDHSRADGMAGPRLPDRQLHLSMHRRDHPRIDFAGDESHWTRTRELTRLPAA